MRKQISKAMIIVLALASLSQFVRATPAPPQVSAANAYGLGVSMGFASFQSVVGQHGYWLTRDALVQARGFANQLKNSVPKLNVATLGEMINHLNKMPGGWQPVIDNVAPRIVTTRGEYSGTLQQASKRAGDAYDLGVAISIAEAQATVGDPARQIVRSSLMNAKAPAGRLGLPVNELSKIINQINQGAPMNSIYNQVTFVRGKFQALL
jgi:hypothetical protein